MRDPNRCKTLPAVVLDAVEFVSHCFTFLIPQELGQNSSFICSGSQGPVRSGYPFPLQFVTPRLRPELAQDPGSAPAS